MGHEDAKLIIRARQARKKGRRDWLRPLSQKLFWGAKLSGLNPCTAHVIRSAVAGNCRAATLRRLIREKRVASPPCHESHAINRAGFGAHSMKQVTYCVVSREGAWAVRLNEKYFGPCSSESRAINAAIGAATKALTLGCSARVLVRQGDTLHVVWSNGRGHAIIPTPRGRVLGAGRYPNSRQSGKRVSEALTDWRK